MTTMTEDVGTATKSQHYDRHELSNFMRPFSRDERARLYDSLKRDGYDPGHPVVLYQGEILDGFNRWAACDTLGITPIYTTFEGTRDQAEAYVRRANLVRRHLNMTQIALAEMSMDAAKPEHEQRSDAQLAGEIHASTGTVAKARMIMEMEPEDRRAGCLWRDDQKRCRKRDEGERQGRAHRQEEGHDEGGAEGRSYLREIRQ